MTSNSSRLIGIVLLLVVIAVVVWQVSRARHTVESLPALPNAGTSAVGEKAGFTVESRPIGKDFDEPPIIGNIKIADLDGDGLKDVLVCDMKTNQVGWIQQQPAGVYTEITFPFEIKAPAHIEPFDIDADGDLDLLVASMGVLFPSNEKIGSVYILENDGQQNFTAHRIVRGIARVTDVRAADLDGDGRNDLIVGEFGYVDGEVRWMRNIGNWEFEGHVLSRLSGAIHTPVTDVDGDGDLDILALISQEWEEIHLFDNKGQGEFEDKVVWGSTNQDYASSGMYLADIDQDGDLDLLYTNGDAFDYVPPRPRPWHGVQWLEHTAQDKFVFHRIGDLPGAYSAVARDVDNDGDVDIIACSCFNLWDKPNAVSLVWFENDGRQRFTMHPLATEPTHLVCIDADDMDGDGKIEIVSAGMHVYPPYDHMGRITLWEQRSNGAP